MALNYRYDKKGNVTGIGWGKGKNYEAGQKAQTKNTEKLKKNTKKKSTRQTPAQKAGLSEDQIKAAKKRTKTFKEDRKIKDKSKKSYNKGKAKKDHVGSAYERRQKDADKAMRDAAAKRHKAWKEARAAKKADKNRKKTIKKQTGSKAGKVKGSNKYDFTTM